MRPNIAESRTSIVLLDESSNQQAMIRMGDGDTFFIAVTEAARACQAIDKAREFGPQFRELLETLTRWIENNRNRITSAHLTIRDQDILFLVMQKEAAFDQEITDSLTELDLSIANRQDLNLIHLDVLAIPAVSSGSSKAFLATGQIYTYVK